MTRNAEWPTRFEDHEYPQVIPEPDDIVRGAPAPWSHLSDAERGGFSLDLVVERLRASGRTFDAAPMPSDPAEMIAVADAHHQPITRKAAVLVALFEEDGETQVILTRRSFELRNHRGEIALPGGRCEDGETQVEAALREAHEEVGVDPALVEPVAWLSPIVTFASGSAIWPVVGLLAGRPTMVAEPSEVERVFTVALRELVGDGAFIEERWRRELPRPGIDADGYFPIYFYRVPGDVIWGATARVLTELLCIAAGVQWPDERRLWA
jgi:8-oxo-dGTP pyrophosphatase MutT (NUDIX family)